MLLSYLSVKPKPQKLRGLKIVLVRSHKVDFLLLYISQCDNLLCLKGVFAKNERGYKKLSKNYRWWLLLILILSVATCVCKEKFVKNCLIIQKFTQNFRIFALSSNPLIYLAYYITYNKNKLRLFDVFYFTKFARKKHYKYVFKRYLLHKTERNTCKGVEFLSQTQIV